MQESREALVVETLYESSPLIEEYESRYGVFDENKNRHGAAWWQERQRLAECVGKGGFEQQNMECIAQMQSTCCGDFTGCTCSLVLSATCVESVCFPSELRSTTSC